MDHLYQPLKDAAVGISTLQVSLTGTPVFLPSMTVNLLCTRDECPDAYWQKRLQYMPDHKAYVGSVWPIGGNTLAINTRSEMLAEVKPPQYSIHNRPEDIAWVKDQVIKLFARAGWPAPEFKQAFDDRPTPAWDSEIVLNFKTETGAIHVSHAVNDVTNIKPCPFCGGRRLVLLGPNFGAHLYCIKCLSQTAYLYDSQSIIDAWNHRVEGSRDECPFCGSEDVNLTGDSFAVCRECQAVGPRSQHIANGQVYEAKWLWKARNGAVTIPAPDTLHGSTPC